MAPDLLTVMGMASMVFVAAFTWHAYGLHPGEGQSPKSAVIEAWINIGIGFTLNFLMNLLLIPLAVGETPSAAANWWMGWCFTTVSILRQYVIRRWFNARLVAQLFAGERRV